MKPLDITTVNSWVETNIGDFHKARVAKITTLTLSGLLKGKNPYLFKAKDSKTTDELIRSILDAFLSSGEETMFGNFLEQLAIFVNTQVYGGQKSATPGIDLDFARDGIRYLVAVKSGPNWGNAGQIAKMITSFQTAKRILATSGHKGHIEFVNGCCYGVDDNPHKTGNYYKYCGERFWTFISNEPLLYEELIVPLGHGAPEWNEKVAKIYDETLARISGEFVAGELADADGKINWRKLIQVTSKARR